MGNRYKVFLGKLGRLFSRYPKEPGVRPDVFANIGCQPQVTVKEAGGVLAIQSVPDKFYFLLFGALRACLRGGLRGPAELVVVRAISGAVGTGWLAGVKRMAPVSRLWSGPWVRAYGSLVNGVAYWCATWAHPRRNLADWIESKALWRRFQHQGEGCALQIDGIEVGDLVVDSYLRFKPSPEFDVADPFVRHLIWQALRDVRQAHAYFGRVRPCIYLTSYTTYLEHGIPARVALRHGVDVWAFGNLNRFGKRLNSNDTYHTQDFSGYRREFEALDRQSERLQEARVQLENRLSGGIDAATSYMRESAYARADVKLPAGLNGAVVVFLHDFYDSPHVYPDLVFNDFWRWICCTIEVLQKTGVTFFLKPHPNQIVLSNEALDRLRQKYPDLKWLPAGASNVRLAAEGIACGVTVYGTVAHELAYLGIPSIGCARHPHHAFDFCRTAGSRQEYEELLKTYWEMPLTKEEMQSQSLAFYYMQNLHGTGDERELRRAFSGFWKACNAAEVTEEGVLDGFSSLVRLPEFGRSVTAMVA